MIVYASNGREYEIDAVEAEVLGGPESGTLVLRDGAGDAIAFFTVDNIDGWGHKGSIQPRDSNAN